jgi:hypothetical protein
MLDPDSPLGEKLRAHRVRMRTDGPDTLILHNVPANPRYFNKPGTNVMVKRARASLPFLIAVDADLAYSGPDPALCRAFAAGTTQQGWRIVFLDSRGEGQWAEVVEDALQAVGFDGAEPRWRSREEPAGSEEPGLLARFGVDCAPQDVAGTAGRDDALREVMSVLMLAHARMPVVLGQSGIGKSHLLRAVAGECRRLIGARMLAVDLCHLFSGTALDAERENLLAGVVEEAARAGGTVLALERLDLVFTETRLGPGALARAIDAGARLVGTAPPGLLPRLEHSPLARRLHPLLLLPLGRADTVSAVRLALPALTAHHGLSCPDALADAIVDASRGLAGCQPAAAVALADAAYARARLDGAPEVAAVHVYLAAGALDQNEE